MDSQSDLATLKAELALARARIADDAATIARQSLEIAKLKRQIYGPRSERTARLIDQMELELEDLEAAATEDEIAAEQVAARTTSVAAFCASILGRRKRRLKRFGRGRGWVVRHISGLLESHTSQTSRRQSSHGRSPVRTAKAKCQDRDGRSGTAAAQSENCHDGDCDTARRSGYLERAFHYKEMDHGDAAHPQQ